MRQFVIGHFDLCSGCRICELVCSWAKYGAYAPRKAVIDVKIGFNGLMVQPVTCIQCENPFCTKACPFGSLERDDKLGAIIVIDDKCTGCGLCVKACPIGAIKIDAEMGKAIKCDLCGGDPACVRYCPTKALVLK